MISKRNKWFLIIIYPVFMALAVIGYLLSNNQLMEQLHPDKTSQDHFTTDITYLDLPRLTVTMNQPYRNYTLLRLDLSLEIEKKHTLEIQGIKPRIMDQLTNFIGEQDFTEINSQRAQRYFRMDILSEVNRVTYPLPVKDIVFRQMVFL